MIIQNVQVLGVYSSVGIDLSTSCSTVRSTFIADDLDINNKCAY